MATRIWLGTSSSSYTATGNWADATVPIDDDDVVISAHAVNAITSNLDQSAVSLNSFVVEDGFNHNIGTTSAMLQILLLGDGPTVFKYAGTGTLARIDLGATTLKPEIRNTGTPNAGAYGLELKGTAMAGIDIYKGNVGIGTTADDTTTEVDAIRVMYTDASTRASDATVTIGQHVDEVGGNAIHSIVQTGGTVYCKAAVSTVKVTNGEYHQLDGVYSLGEFKGNSSLFIENDAAGTIKTTRLWDQSVVQILSNFTQTLSSLSMYPGTTWIDEKFVSTYSTGIDVLGDTDSVTIKLGPGISLAPTAV